MLLVTGCALAAGPSAETHYALRGYRAFTGTDKIVGEQKSQVEVRSFDFESPERASIFASKIYTDYQETIGNVLATITTSKGPVDAISLQGTDFILPLIERDGKKVTVLIGQDQGALKAQADTLLTAIPLRATEVKHPQYMDKWDQYCMGVWNRISDMREDPTHKTPESYYGWLAKIGLNPQLVGATDSQDLTANDNLLRWIRKYFSAADTHYQNVEWLQAYPDLYNRNPFLSSFDGPGMMTPWSYYGETPHAPGLLRDVQHAPIMKELRDYTHDDNLMAILDPDGEVGPFPYFKWGEYGPVQRRNFVRYLRDVRHFSLTDVSRRYFGKPDALASWDDITLADWRTFYGWDDHASLDLQGEWHVMREGDAPGLRLGWQSPAFNDADWIRLSYPGDMTLYTLPDGGNPKPLWMRRTIKVNPQQFPGTIYLSVAPLCDQAVQVFVDGKRIGQIAPRFHTGKVFGQFDVTQLVHDNPTLAVALRFGANDIPCGPVFLTSKPLQDFPTEDPLLNARRFDLFDFMDWAVSDSVGSTLRQIRSIDPDRPIKVHAYDSSAWGYKITNELGGYSHHTGAGAGWAYTVPKQYDLTRETQDSCETGGSMETPRNIKGLIGCLAFMGKNAHDYFYDLQDITKDPAVLDWWVKRLPEMRLLGRMNVDESPLACLRGLRNSGYVGEFYKTENWRYGYNLTKGGEMTPLLDEIRVGEGHLPYPAILDEGTVVWDEAMATSLQKYVEEGGTLFLTAPCGLHTPTQRNADPGATLAGVKIVGKSTDSIHVQLTAADPVFGNRIGDVGNTGPHLMSEAHVITALPGTDVIGTTDVGQPAITRRAIGKGAVYYCAGGNWPGAIQQEILNHFAPKVFATKEGTGVDLLRTFRSNNGCEDLMMVRGLGGNPATIHWTFDYTPTAIYNPVTNEQIPATIDGTTATFTVKLDDWDFACYAARRPDIREQFSHWLQRQTEIWHGLIKGDPLPDPPLFRTLDLNRGWKLVQTNSKDDAEKRMGMDDQPAGLVPTDLGWWSAPGTGLKSGRGVFGLYRRDFKLPAGWEKNATIALNVDGRVYNWPQVGFGGPSTIYFNGKQIWSGDSLNQSVCFDVTGNLKPGGDNRIEIVHEGEGVLANIQVVRTVTPDTTVNLAGDWQAIDGLQSVRTIQLPGKAKTSFVYRDVTVPKEQAGKEVWVRVDTEGVGSSTFVIINGRERYPVTRPDNSRPMEVNITPEVRFGETNRILIGSGAMGGWRTDYQEYRKLELCFYKPGSWSPHGKGIESALTPRELESVKEQEARVQLFPLVQNAVAKPPMSPFPFSEADAAAYTPPSPALDLDLSKTDGTVADRSSQHVPVTVVGKIVPFTERGGAVTGQEILGEDESHGYLSLPMDPMTKMLWGKDFTLAAWFKPMQDKKNAVVLAQWGLALQTEITEKNFTYYNNDQASEKLAANDVLTPRQWHFIAISNKGNHATLYVDGLNVADQTFSSPLGEGRTPFIVGGTLRNTEFSNLKLASFIIYPEALNDDGVGKLYLRDKASFESTPDKAWPEDYLCRFDITANGVTDKAEFPAQLVLGSGTTTKTVDGKPVLDFDGVNSSILVKDNPHENLVGSPFSIIFDISPAQGSEGCLFRKTFNPGLWLRKDGSLMLDANSGRNSQLIFTNAVVAGKWNRLMLTYDGQTASLFRDGTLLDRKSYPGSLDVNRDRPLGIGGDCSTADQSFVNRPVMQMREFGIFPRVLDVMPPAP